MLNASSLEDLAAQYLAPWRARGISQQMVDYAHHHWADYRDDIDAKFQAWLAQ